MEDARQDFLGDATRLLHAAQPSLSADLHLRRVETQSINAKRNGDDHSFRCSSCGTLSLTNWHLDTLRLGSKHQRVATRKCLACNRVTKLIGTPQGKTPRFDKTPTAATIPVALEKLPNKSPDRPETNPKLSSKKRAKARKDREGLQVLLDKSRPDSDRSRLSLMDFVQR